jgi:hypothetical protein
VGVIAWFFSDRVRLFASIVDGGGRVVEPDLLTSVDATDWRETPIATPRSYMRLASNGEVSVLLVDGTVYVHQD